MAYADRNTSGSRAVSIVVVSIIVALFAWGFVNGLTFKYVKKVTDKLNTFNVVPPPPPPPPDKPPPPEKQQPQLQVPPVVSPPPIVRVQSPPPPIVTVANPPPVAPVTVVAVPAPPPTVIRSAVSVVSKAAGAKGDPSLWITEEDYPADALSSGAQGTSEIRWDINSSGRVENCAVVKSSGSALLDRAACQALIRHARYTPALDQNGAPMRTTGQSRRVVWRLPSQ